MLTDLLLPGLHLVSGVGGILPLVEAEVTFELLLHNRLLQHCLHHGRHGRLLVHVVYVCATVNREDIALLKIISTSTQFLKYKFFKVSKFICQTSKV